MDNQTLSRKVRLVSQLSTATAELKLALGRGDALEELRRRRREIASTIAELKRLRADGALE